MLWGDEVGRRELMRIRRGAGWFLLAGTGCVATTAYGGAPWSRVVKLELKHASSEPLALPLLPSTSSSLLPTPPHFFCISCQLPPHPDRKEGRTLSPTTPSSANRLCSSSLTSRAIWVCEHMQQKMAVQQSPVELPLMLYLSLAALHRCHQSSFEEEGRRGRTLADCNQGKSTRVL